MKSPAIPLAYRLFGAIALTALLIVGSMATLVAISMRDGFSKYLQREELALHSGLVDALALAYDPAAMGWPDLSGKPDAWRRFIDEHGSRPLGRPERPNPPPPDRLEPLPPPVQLEDRLVLLDALGAKVVGGGAQSLTEGLETLAIRAPNADAQSAPLGWLAVAAPTKIQKQTDVFFLRSQFQSLAFSAALALALSGIGAALLARQFLVPIRALERGAKRLAGGEYASRIPAGRNDELGQLINHYNALADSLEKAERAQHQWVSDTSHELQTPLAILRAHIEAIQDGVRAPDARTLGAMEDAVDRLTRLVADLRILSAWREGGLIANRGPADLARIARTAVDSVSESFAAVGLDLVTEIADPIRLTCDAGRIRQVIDNLLANSLRYTDAPGTVRLRAWSGADSAYLTIDDTAPAPPEMSLPHLFERFHRGEASRARVHGGSGLGLAICKAIVEAHGGKISAVPSRLGGLHIQMTLPYKAAS